MDHLWNFIDAISIQNLTRRQIFGLLSANNRLPLSHTLQLYITEIQKGSIYFRFMCGCKGFGFSSFFHEKRSNGNITLFSTRHSCATHFGDRRSVQLQLPFDFYVVKLYWMSVQHFTCRKGISLLQDRLLSQRWIHTRPEWLNDGYTL